MTRAQQVEALGECLSSALDNAGIYELDDDDEWRAAVGVFAKMLSGFQCHRWRASPPTMAALYVDGVEPWIMEAMEYALHGRGPDEECVWVCPVTIV